jgi:hypothetical protein
MTSTVTHETHPVDGQNILVSTPAGETSPPIWMAVGSGPGIISAYLIPGGGGTGAIEISYSLPSAVRAGSGDTWSSLVAATGTAGPYVIPPCTAIRLKAAVSTAKMEVRFVESQ